MENQLTLTLLFAGILVNKGSKENEQIHLYHALLQSQNKTNNKR